MNKLAILKNKWRVPILSLAAYTVTSLALICFLPSQQSLEMIFLLTYMTCACTFFPLPTPQIIMAYGGRFNPILVAVVGAIGTCMAGLIDYTVMTYVLEFKKIAKLKETNIYRYCTWLYNKIAFISLVIAGFIPIPFEPFRCLAGATRYSKGKYVLALFIGRGLRYYLLVKIQCVFHIPRSILIGSIVLIGVIIMIKIIYRKVSQSRKPELPLLWRVQGRTPNEKSDLPNNFTISKV
jgi:membrane protein YqaA with SNARE-associated domain